jgi:hypothetical protein
MERMANKNYAEKRLKMPEIKTVMFHSLGVSPYVREMQFCFGRVKKRFNFFQWLFTEAKL